MRLKARRASGLASLSRPCCNFASKWGAPVVCHDRDKTIDPATDYMPTLVNYVRDNKQSWMIPRFEGPNELWNGHGGFYNTTYANAKANAYKVADPTHWSVDNDYAQLVRQDHIGVRSRDRQHFMFGADRTKYHVLCGVQTGNGNTTGNTASVDPRMRLLWPACEPNRRGNNHPI